MEKASLDNRERILCAARDLFGVLGYAETTYKRIAQRLGIAEGLIAHHYGSKENLFLQVQLRILHDLEARMAEAEYFASNGLSALMSVGQSLLAASQDPESGCLTLLRCSPLFSLEGQATVELASRCQAIISRVIEAIVRGQEDGSILSDLNPEIAASVFFSLVFGAIRARLLTPAQGVLGLRTDEAFYSEIVRLVQRYFSSSSSWDGAMR
jgi:AcrR family transcriptional regulator